MRISLVPTEEEALAAFKAAWPDHDFVKSVDDLHRAFPDVNPAMAMRALQYTMALGFGLNNHVGMEDLIMRMIEILIDQQDRIDRLEARHDIPPT